MSAANKRKLVLLDRELQLRVVFRLASSLMVGVVVYLCLAVAVPMGYNLLAGDGTWDLMQVLLRPDVLLFAVVLPLTGTFLCLFGRHHHRLGHGFQP